MISDHERHSAHALVAALRRAGVDDARASGAGVHWNVDAGAAGSRNLLVRCFWYTRAIGALTLGMNPANARARPSPSRAPYEGPEYFALLRVGDERIADGRARDAASVVACARAWLAGVELDQLVLEVPFVDEGRRRIRAFAGRIDPRLRRSIGGDPAYELWVYGEGRSCRITCGEPSCRCCFFVGQAQAAAMSGEDREDLAAAIHGWLLDGVCMGELTTQFPAVVLEPHAELLEVDPARWHWHHVRDRIADPHDVLAPLRALIERLATSSIASTFYSYTSLHTLCFSASSHFPWVDEGLPVVTPGAGETCYVDETVCDYDRAVELVEARLRASTTKPFFGSAPHHELPLLAERLSRLGTCLTPRIVQSGAWYALVVTSDDGARRCDVGALGVTLSEGSDELRAGWPSLDDVARVIRDFCERRASLDEIAHDARAQYVRRGKAIIAS